MKLVQTLPTLLAETSTDKGSIHETWWFVLLALFAVIAVSYLIGKLAGKRLRMTDYGWKIGLILSAVGCGVVVVVTGWPPKYGVDLRGGVTLVYQVEEPEDKNQEIDESALVEALKRRINPAGTKEIVIRPYGTNQIEVIVPEVDQNEIEQLKKRLISAGVLKFRIVATPADKDHQWTIKLAREQAEDKLASAGRWVYEEVEAEDDQGRTQVERIQKGVWVRVAREAKKVDGRFPLKVDVVNDVIRNSNAKDGIKEIISNIPPKIVGISQPPDARRLAFSQWLDEQGIKDVDVLMIVPDDDEVNVEGDHVAVVRSSRDEKGNPSISFNMSGEGAIRMGNLTGENKPKGNLTYALGIVFDNQLISAPVIRSTITQRGEISGNFTQAEVDELVSLLRAGRLPATLKEQPLSEDRIDSQLGRDMRNRGVYAIGVSLLVVLLFMVVYYRFSGVVACFALITNIVMIVAMVILVKQPFTLTGLAGLVLTVGMSVDANVLIFERIREELSRGSALRMAMRNGFARATTTIVDANLTTLITAIVLYTIGTDQIRGFAVALILGILMCMFTAIFCSRVVFDIAERQRWITKLSMMHLIGTSRFDFVGKQKIAAALSVLLIVVGLAAVVTRGPGILAIDLAGGQSVRMVLNEPMEVEEVRTQLRDKLGSLKSKVGKRIDFTVNEIDRTEDGLDRNTVFKIDASIPTPDPKEKKESDVELTSVVTELFGGRLAMYSMEFELAEPVAGKAAKAASPQSGDAPSAPNGSDGARLDLPPDTMLALADEPETGSASDDATSPDPTVSPEETPSGEDAASTTAGNSQPTETTTPEAGTTSAETDESEALTTQPSATDPPLDATVEPPTKQPLTTEPAGVEPPQQDLDEPTAPVASDRVMFNVVFGHDITADTLREEINEVAEKRKLTAFDATNENSVLVEDVKQDASGYHKRLALAGIGLADAQDVISDVKASLESKAYFRGSSGVGSQIAGDTQTRAIAAMLASLICIIIYIWIRFQKVEFGLAAVVALVHDVLFVLGAIAASAYLAVGLGFLGVEEFKISLPVIAAFLTIIGYSLNDTIVVFDRIREVRGKSPELTGDMINRSIGQTLSRTLLTSVTTLIVVVILYGWGGEAIHGFAFALVVGVLVGTYSSIFVASPALLWMMGRRQPKDKSARGQLAAEEVGGA